MDEKLQKLILEQKKDDTLRVRKQTFSDKTSVVLANIDEERSMSSDSEETDISDLSKETLLKLIQVSSVINRLTPREKVLFLAHTIGGLAIRDIQKVFEKPLKRSMIAKIISEIKEEIKSEKLDRSKNIFSVDRKRNPRDSRAKYF